MKQIPSPPETAVITGDFTGFSGADLYEHLTRPELLVTWWPHVAEIEARVGGKLHLAWPDNDWHLRGEFTALEAGEHVGFTWQWDHDQSAGIKQVDAWIIDLGESGSRLAIYHGPFEATEHDQANRQGIIEGWIHFGMVLAGLRVGNAL